MIKIRYAYNVKTGDMFPVDFKYNCEITTYGLTYIQQEELLKKHGYELLNEIPEHKRIKYERKSYNSMRWLRKTYEYVIKRIKGDA